MKKVFKFSCLILLLILTFGFIAATCNNPNQGAENDSLSNDSVVTNSAETKKINTDSIVKAFRSDFTFKKDEFDNKTWVEPKNRPKFVNVNGVFAYFELNDNVATNFRFSVQYTSDDWLFIQQILFNVDGKHLTFIPQKMEHDNEDYIWEWFDEQITIADEPLIKAIANAKTVKMKLQGKQYYNIRSLTQREIQYLKKTYNFYKALGGQFPV